MQEIPPPRATRDYLPEEAAARQRILARFAATAAAYGYQPVETPMYEKVELFSARSGPEMKSSMLTFHCDHEEFALRPELTAPVCRLVASGAFDGRPKPHRLSYSGSCFRYVRPGSGRNREFTQVGLELLGESGPQGDAEIIAAACRFLRKTGIEDFTLRIGTVAIFRDLLPDSLDAEERSSVIGHLDRLVGIRERCEALAASDDRVLLEELKIDRREVAEVQDRAGYEGEYRVTAHPGIHADEMASRLPLEAEAALRAIWAAEEIMPEERAETLLSVSRLRGSLESVVRQAREALENTPASKALADLLEVCLLVEHYGIRTTEVVLGIARGLTFYTGTVFELSTGRLKYGGGGRYDGLVELFGGQPTPAVGCAFRVDALMETLQNGAQPEKPYDLYLSAADPADAIPAAEELRARGLRVGAGPSRDAAALADLVVSVEPGGRASIGGQPVEFSANALEARAARRTAS